MTLFSLNLTDLALSDKTHREDFFIGLFGTRAQAEAVAAHYLKQVPGFCDYDCTYRVEEKAIHDTQGESLPDFVWQFAGWDETKDGEPVNIIESDFFLTEEQAAFELDYLKLQCPHQEWCIRRRKIGEMLWQNGFVRV